MSERKVRQRNLHAELPDEVLLRLLAAGLRGEPHPVLPGTVPPETWLEVFRLSAAQGVLALAYDALRRLPAAQQPPRELMLRWAVNTDRIERQFAHRQRALEDLAAFYASHGIRLMLLKGAGLAALYPVPAHRPCGDIDIWLYGRQREADRLVREELRIAVSNDVHHHTIFSYKGVMIENHFDFLNLWSHRSNRELERHLHRFAEKEGGRLAVGDREVALPPPDFNALFLMRHMAVHFAAVEIGLRHLADWAMFLEADGRKVDWPTIRAIYKEQNMDRFADAATAICVERLGVSPDRAYDYTQDEVLQNELLNETLHPLFSEKHPDRGIAAPALFKLRRWWANRWKHRLVYKDSLAGSFLWLCWAHLIRPRSIIK